MGSTAWKALCAIEAILFAAMCGVAIFGGCDGVVELASGSATPMKCHWTFVAEAFVAPAGIVAALLACFARTLEGRRIAAVMALAVLVVVALLPSPVGIGICPSAEMGCKLSAAITWVLAAAASIVALVLCLKADPDQAQKPKRSL